jgi:ketosteroid isomerase-like protein
MCRSGRKAERSALHGKRNISRDTARAMSEENVEIVRALYAAWSADDLDTVLEVYHPEVELRTSGSFPDLEPSYGGHSGVRLFWDAMLAPWDSFQIDVERVVEGDECAAVAIRFRARGKVSDALTDMRQGHVLRFKDGRVAKVSFHNSLDEALEAAGLSE